MGRRKKINESDIIDAFNSGHSRAEISKMFGCSIARVGQLLIKHGQRAYHQKDKMGRIKYEL